MAFNQLLTQSSDTAKLMKVAMGEAYADLIIVNAQVLNVYTGEVLQNCSIGTSGQQIAYVNDDAAPLIGPESDVIDVQGQIVIPGLIDGHTHLSWLYTPAEFLKYVMPGGTTTIITETLEFYPMCGDKGLLDFLNAIKDQPIKILATLPAMASISKKARGVSSETVLTFLARNDIVGLGESYWQEVLQNPELFLPLFDEVKRAGKTLEGHSAGANPKKLMAYVAAGISSCHEPIKADEVLERLRLGLHVMIREGSIRRDLAAIAKIRNAGADLRRLTLVTDGISPEDLVNKGYMEYLVQKAINCGFDPVTSIRMATLNIAEHFRLDHLIGGIAPGRQADMVVIPDLQTISAQYVISNGKLIARQGQLLVQPRQHNFAPESMASVRFKSEIRPSAFRIDVVETSANQNISANEPIRVRVIEMLTPLVTGEKVMELPVQDGQIRPDANQNLVKVAAVDRTHYPGKTFCGLIRGFGLQSGAIASSAAWDATAIVVVGANNEDMALAVNRIHSLQGGVVVCNRGQIQAELATPIFSLLADLPMATLVRKVAEVNQAAAALGIPFADPILSLITLTGAAIPFLRICEEGLVNLKDGKTKGLSVSDGD